MSERRDLAIATTRSAAFHEYAKRYAPNGVLGGGRYWRPYPLCIARAAGSRLWDVDGNEYIDYHGSYGPSVLGQNDEEVREAVVEVLESRGVLFALPHELEIELCRRITELVPSAEKVILTCAGTEATYHAVRVARAFTGRERILKFEGAYHGWHDSVNETSGTPRGVAELTDVVSWNDTDALERKLDERGDEIACVILEPVVHAFGVLEPAPGFLQRCRELCTEHGALLVFDEMITGFRHDLGGCQTLFGVTPDLTTFGKAIANGFPISGLAGRNDVMSLIEPEGPVSYSGTFNGSLVPVAAALKTLEIMERDRIHARLFELGAALAGAINEEIERLELPAQCRHFGSIWCVYFTDRELRSYSDIAAFAATKDTGIDAEFQSYLLDRGIYLQPFWANRAFTSAAHSDADIERTIEVVTGFLGSAGDRIREAHAEAYA